MSVTALANDVTSEIGEVVPLLSDVKVSSLISLECMFSFSFLGYVTF